VAAAAAVPVAAAVLVPSTGGCSKVFHKCSYVLSLIQRPQQIMTSVLGNLIESEFSEVDAFLNAEASKCKESALQSDTAVEA
jgi:hypothetical protein